MRTGLKCPGSSDMEVIIGDLSGRVGTDRGSREHGGWEAVSLETSFGEFGCEREKGESWC